MHSLVIYIGGVGKFGSARRLAIVFLLVHDIVLRAGNDTGVLNALDGLLHGNAGQNRIWAESYSCLRPCVIYGSRKVRKP